MNIYILEEEVFNKRYYYKNEYNIEQLLSSDFVLDDNYLFDYKINKLNKYVDVYAVKGGSNIDKLCKDATNLQVIPIQLKIAKDIKGKIRDKVYGLIITIKDIYYYICVANKRVIRTIVEKEEEIFKERIKKYSTKYPTYIENRVKDNFKLDKCKKIKLKGSLYSELFI